jgi:hypothetical protein
MNKRGLEIKYVIIFIIALLFLLLVVMTEFPQLTKLFKATDSQIKDLGEGLGYEPESFFDNFYGLVSLNFLNYRKYTLRHG